MDSNGLSNLICYFTEEYDAQLLSSMLKAAFPGIPIIGCSSC
ncbi:TPA: histidine kinase, partial [Vibrio cholerae]|nr:histidine kinase [Vibrio cholerae]